MRRARRRGACSRRASCPPTRRPTRRCGRSCISSITGATGPADRNAAVVDLLPEDRQPGDRIVADVLADGRTVLTEPEAKAVLKAYDIPVVETLTAADPAEAGAVAARLGFPVVLKVLSPTSPTSPTSAASISTCARRRRWSRRRARSCAPRTRRRRRAHQRLHGADDGEPARRARAHRRDRRGRGVRPDHAVRPRRHRRRGDRRPRDRPAAAQPRCWRAR